MCSLRTITMNPTLFLCINRILISSELRSVTTAASDASCFQTVIHGLDMNVCVQTHSTGFSLNSNSRLTKVDKRSNKWRREQDASEDVQRPPAKKWARCLYAHYKRTLMVPLSVIYYPMSTHRLWFQTGNYCYHIVLIYSSTLLCQKPPPRFKLLRTTWTWTLYFLFVQVFLFLWITFYQC